jgi:hypothetical protein
MSVNIVIGQYSAALEATMAASPVWVRNQSRIGSVGEMPVAIGVKPHQPSTDINPHP